MRIQVCSKRSSHSLPWTYSSFTALSMNDNTTCTVIQTWKWKWSRSVAQSCLTLCDPMDCSLPGSPVHGIFQARVLEWVAISFSRGSSHPGIEPGSPALQADALLPELPGKPCFYRKRQNIVKSMDFGVRKKSTHSLLCHCSCVTLNILLKIF